MVEKNEIQHFGIVNLISQIKKGIIRIPDFQRDYVWAIDDVDDLLKSVWEGYPLGSILFWRTQEKLQERDPLDLKLPEPQHKAEKLYLLDGQQRLVTLYSLLVKGFVEIGKRKTKQYVFFDLKNKVFISYSEMELKDKKPKIENGLLEVNKIMVFDSSFTSVRQDEDVLRNLSKDVPLIVTYTELHNKFNSIEFPAILSSQSLSVACRIFERLNNTGTQLTIADLMVATTYTSQFNLREKMEELNSSLAPQAFDISERTILQCMSACIKKGTKREDIIDSSNVFESNWDKVTNSIRLSIDFLKSHCSVPVSKFLPNEIMLTVLTRFFYFYGNKQLSTEYIKKLKKYFWISSFYQTYASSQDSVAEEDLKFIDSILSNLQNDFNDKKIKRFSGKIDELNMKFTDTNFGASFAKAILCFLASKTPQEFRNNAVVKLDQTFSEANLRQLHHIFPINYLKNNMKGKKNRQLLSMYSNSISNISLISATTNRDIWDSSPSEYFGRFSKENNNLQNALDSHLIKGLKEFGLNDNNFEKFIDSRSKLISESVNAFIGTL